jgi:hypothetical protein
VKIRAAIVVAMSLVGLAMLTPVASADEQAQEPRDPATLFRAATDALAGERPNEAIADLEALEDRGVVDAVVSYDRGLAYAARVRAAGDRPGDLGRAAHGFEEARELSDDPTLIADATRALSMVRGEIARRRARAGEQVELEHGISLGRSIVKLLPENTWAVLAALAAAALTVGMVIVARAKDRRQRVAGTTTCAVAGALLVAIGIVVHAARDARFHLREGVVIASSRLLDERHIAKEGLAPVPEGARARIVGEDADMVHVEIGHADGWLPSGAVLPLAKR